MTGPGNVVAGRYRLLSRIGGGGMGAVWLAADELLGRQVAVKQVLPAARSDPAVVDQQRQRALREGRIAARLTHPHTISVYDVALEGGSPWLVMEYLPSRSLAEVLHEDGVLRVDQVAQIGAQVADAMAATHAAGIVHRDIKPANVLIGQGPGVEGLVKITDFGISHASGDVTLTQTGQITGTPAFLAPEVAQGADMTEASDVFSLGATLYTCLEGQPPFGMDDNALRLLHRVAAGDWVPPGRAGSMTEPLTRMLAADPAQRQTMAEVRDELVRLAAGRDGDPTTVLVARTKLRSSTNRNRTSELSPGTAAAATPAAGARSPATAVQDVPAPPAAAPPPATPAPRSPAPPPLVGPRRRRRGPLIVAALVLAVVLAGLGALWAATRGGAEGGEATADPPPASSSAGAEEPSQSPAPESSAPAPSSDTADDAPSAGEPPADDPAAVAQQTLDDYYAFLPGDTDAAYAMTGPTLRSVASEAYYRDYFAPWSEVSLRALRDVAEPEDGVVTATTEVLFSRADGSSQAELHEVRFIRADDGQWLVDLDRFVRSIS